MSVMILKIRLLDLSLINVETGVDFFFFFFKFYLG